jgi:hypothetical protein
MKYNLWGTEFGRYLGYFEDERKALELVRMLLDHHGDDYANDLGLGRVTDQGEILEPLMGAALIARVNEMFPGRHNADQGRGAAIAS